MSICLWLLAVASASPLEALSHVQSLLHTAEEMFDHGFRSYVEYALPGDMLRSVSCKPRYRANRAVEQDYEEFVLGNFSMTLIDSLDSLIVFNRTADFAKYAQYVIDNVSFDRDVTVSLFEVNIRVLGGLLSAHVLQSQLGLIPDYKARDIQDGLLNLAEDLGRRVLPAFNTSTGIPYSHINLKWGLPANPTDSITTAEASTILLEFTLLSYLTGDYTYRDTAQRVLLALLQASTDEFMSGTVINIHTGKWMTRYMTIGASLDSYYEYLVKAYIAYGCEDCLRAFYKAYESVQKYMVHDGWILEVNIDRKVIHSASLSSLAAFWPGLEVSLGHLEQAVELHYLFYSIWAHYSAIPDMFNLFDGTLMMYGRNYPLRPELIESTYYLYQATHEPVYLYIAEKMMTDINSNCRTSCGFATLADVTKGYELNDNMESFFLSETMKYLYLLFREAEDFYYEKAIAIAPLLHTDMTTDIRKRKDLVNYQKFVFSTEGHFFPILKEKRLFHLGFQSPPPKEIEVCKKPDQNAIAGLINDHVLDIYFSHGHQNRTHPIRVKQRPRVFDALPMQLLLSVLASLPSNDEEPMTLMRMFVLNGTQVLEEMLVSVASFGLSFPKHFTYATKLVIAEPIIGCTPLQQKDGRFRKKVFPRQFVLMIRGECMFIQKAHMAQVAQASGMLVYDNDSRESALLTMKGDKEWPDVQMLGAFTTYTNGMKLM